jgi:hypothetical protein
MKKIRGLLLGGIGVLLSFNLSSQGLPELSLLFARTTPGGSARVLGMGGAQVSFGGDFSSASSNPAGLGMFNRSEFTISPAYALSNPEATHFGASVKNSKSNLSIPSLSVAFHSEKNRGSWIGGTFAITLTRTNDFNSDLMYKGTNPQNSIADFFADDAFGLEPNELGNSLSGLAYENYLIEPTQQLEYFSVVGINHGVAGDVPRMTQAETISLTGGQNQWSASYGVNIDDFLFFGAGLHLRSIRYVSEKAYTESDFYFVADPAFNPLDNLSLEESLKISGAGYAATLGAIVRPFEGFQIGLSLNTPTVYSLSDVYTATITTDWNNFDYYGNGTEILNRLDFSTPEILSDYRLKTPGRVAGGVTYFFGKSGFISGEVEAVNYAGSKYTSKTDDFFVDEDNTIIKDIYKPALNLRVGGEYRLKNFRIRGGIGNQGEVFNEKKNGISSGIMHYALGAGYKSKGFYVDAAFNLSAGKNSYRPYRVPGEFSPLVTIQNRATSFLLTFGFPF